MVELQMLARTWSNQELQAGLSSTFLVRSPQLRVGHSGRPDPSTREGHRAERRGAASGQDGLGRGSTLVDQVCIGQAQAPEIMTIEEPVSAVG